MKAVASRYSIGQRLGIGLGFLFALELALLAAVFIWLRQNDQAHEEYAARVAPRTAIAEQLEQAVLYVAIAVRDHRMEPSVAHARAFEEAAERARALLTGLGAVPVSARDSRHAQAQALVERYVAESEMAVHKRARLAVDDLSSMREKTLASIRQFAGEERAYARAALETIAQNRRRISSTLSWLAVLSGGFFVVGGWLMVRSIRRPVRRLLEFASALEAGNWRVALSLAEPSGPAQQRDEMLRLAHAFGAAAIALEAREQQLQQQNEEIQTQNEEIQAQNEEIQAQNEEIQAQSAEIMAQNSELREQARALNEADEKKNEFLGLLAHELRNPLAPMSNSLALLKRTAGNDTTGAHAILDRQLRHLVHLIDDLLDVTRISRGKIHVRRVPLELTRLLRHCAADLQASVDKKGLALELDLPHASIWVQGDETRLSQVFGNLLGNAVKFTDRGGRIVVTAENGAGRAEACVRVRDTGRGMEPALLGRLFTPFTQGDSELARSSGGLGLGLALVKGLVELHGGRVEAASAGLGQGSEFLVCLPTIAAPKASRGEASTAASCAQTVRRHRVLLIEDNADAAHSLRHLLEDDGHEVRVAHSGPAGVEAAQRFEPDIVLCDIGLPGMDGYEVGRTLRRLPGRRPVLIALTGYATDADMQRTAEAGFDHHFAKPPDLGRLGEILARVTG